MQQESKQYKKVISKKKGVAVRGGLYASSGGCLGFTIHIWFRLLLGVDSINKCVSPWL